MRSDTPPRDGTRPVRAAGIAVRGAVAYLIAVAAFAGLTLFVASGCDWGDDMAGSIGLAAMLLLVLPAVIGGWAVWRRRLLSRPAKLTVVLVLLVGLTATWLAGWYASTLPTGCPV